MMPENPRTRSCPGRAKAEQGYVLLTMLLVVSLMAIAAVAIAPSITFQIKRDRETELIHRGTQYTRAIRLYAKKTGRFPLRLEDLYQAGGVRYLRKIYKDPITGRDFRLLHTADTMPSSVVAPDSSNNDNGNSPDSNQGNDPPVPDTAGATSPATSNGPAKDGSGPANPVPPRTNLAAGSVPAGGVSAGNTFVKDDPTQGLIFGVASTSKSKTIREFDHKNHYNEWLFFYDLSHDRGYPRNGPTPMSLPAARIAGDSPTGQPQESASHAAQQ